MKWSTSNQASNQKWLPLKVDQEPANIKTLEIEEYNDKHRNIYIKDKILKIPCHTLSQTQNRISYRTMQRHLEIKEHNKKQRLSPVRR